ncbi:MAG: hypothetical protein WCT04_15640 [Planctomycetota bacterium]
MALLKTSVALEKSVLKEAGKRAKRMKVSRSRFISNVLEDYFETTESDADITRKIIESYSQSAPLNVDEKSALDGMRKVMLNLQRSDPW